MPGLQNRSRAGGSGIESFATTMPAETGLAAVSSEQALRDANRRFYAAFEAMDVAALDEVWAHEDWVQCVHPGWDLLLGWEEVRDSYVRIFSNTRRMKIALGSLWIRAEGEVGWVACTEQVTSAFADGFDDALVQATNIFVKRDGEWKLVAHHGSPLPPARETTVQ
jgi:ketosteroid isomerase-like protein